MNDISVSGRYGKKPASSGGRRGTDTKPGFDAALTSAKCAAAHELCRPPRTGGGEEGRPDELKGPCVLLPDLGKLRLEAAGYFASQDESGVDECAGEYGEARRRSGYAGLTEDGIREKVREKYGGGTLADKCRMACELSELGIDQAASRETFREAYGEMLKATEAEYGDLPHDDLTRILAMFGYAQGSRDGMHMEDKP